jgi:hypothetical protein
MQQCTAGTSPGFRWAAAYGERRKIPGPDGRQIVTQGFSAGVHGFQFNLLDCLLARLLNGDDRIRVDVFEFFNASATTAPVAEREVQRHRRDAFAFRRRRERKFV